MTKDGDGEVTRMRVISWSLVTHRLICDYCGCVMCAIYEVIMFILMMVLTIALNTRTVKYGSGGVIMLLYSAVTVTVVMKAMSNVMITVIILILVTMMTVL